MVDDHLIICEQCSLAVDDLRAFRSQIAPSLDHEYVPALFNLQLKAGGVGRLELYLRSSGCLRCLRSVQLAILLLAVAGVVILRTLREREPKQEIVVSPTPAPQPTSSLQPEPSQPEPVTIAARLNDGEGVLTLDQEGKLSGADELPPVYQGLLKTALTTRRVEKSSQLIGLARPPSSLMSSNNQKGEFSVIEPIGNVLLTDHPTFRWSKMEGATAYLVEVYDSKFKLVAASPQLSNNLWATPQSLARGQVYAWQVKAIKNGEEVVSPRPPAPPAKFRILDQAKANEVVKARRAYASSHLTLGLLYAEAGLLSESNRN